MNLENKFKPNLKDYNKEEVFQQKSQSSLSTYDHTSPHDS